MKRKLLVGVAAIVVVTACGRSGEETASTGRER